MKYEFPMTDHDREMLKKLCAKVLEERDHVRFTRLLIELDALLEEKMVGAQQGNETTKSGAWRA